MRLMEGLRRLLNRVKVRTKFMLILLLAMTLVFAGMVAVIIVTRWLPF